MSPAFVVALYVLGIVGAFVLFAILERWGVCDDWRNPVGADEYPAALVALVWPFSLMMFLLLVVIVEICLVFSWAPDALDALATPKQRSAPSPGSTPSAHPDGEKT